MSLLTSWCLALLLAGRRFTAVEAGATAVEAGATAEEGQEVRR